MAVRRAAGAADLAEAARLLHAFNTEYDEPCPEPEALAARLAELVGDGDTEVLLSGDEPVGVAVLRLRKSLWLAGLEGYLAELYVAPAERGHGLGRELLNAALDVARERGAGYLDLNTGEDDTAARRLYEATGFSSREGRADGPRNLYYEREL
jgi:ribosomal protein S18 acetylase RimI-like enzyme